jgi:radical SAM protein with 4Fe4S-binding SPASM domain
MKEWLKRLLTFRPAEPASPIAPGLYHAMQETDQAFARFHLRVETDGSGMLIANAMATARLSPTGVVIAKGLLEGKSESEISAKLKKHFSGARDDMIRADIAQVNKIIEQVKAPGDSYPVFNLEDAATSPYSTQLIAPFQASVPLAPPDVMVPILDRLWAVGIPHVTVLFPDNGEPAHLIRAVERAEDLGMIAGVRSRAGNLDDEGFLADLRQAGVDYVTFPYAAPDAAIHDAVCGAGDLAAAERLLAWLEEHQISAVAEIPLIQATLDTLEETVETLIAKGADNLSFVAYATLNAALAEQDGIFTGKGMAQVATTVEEIADLAQARFMWNPPVERDPTKALADQIVTGPRCSGDVAVRVEPNGDVIPPRGRYEGAGNLNDDTWDTIWNAPLFRDYRERVEAPTRCDICPGLTICAAGCPRDPDSWARNA